MNKYKHLDLFVIENQKFYFLLMFSFLNHILIQSLH